MTRVTPHTPLPAITQTRSTEIDFTYVHGRHADADDIVDLADLLGRQHASAYASDLHAAVLDRPHTCEEGTITDFISPRRHRLGTLLVHRTVPHPALTSAAAHTWLNRAATMPAAFYKDANPRNFLITASKTVVVDFDTLTLAPFGYDLAKLIVTTCMTSGPLPEDTIRQALHAYNRHPSMLNLPRCGLDEFAAWTEIHHILTAPYLGSNGYQFSWHHHRPRFLADQL